jgi:hypothetical protein
MQVSVLAGTVFQDTHLPLTVWFRAMWHITSQKNGVSALGLQRALGLGSYKTAWLMLHKLRQAMVCPGRERLRGVVEVDETYWGAAESGGATGRLVYSKALIVVAAEQDGEGIGRIRMARIADFDRATLHGFIRSSVEPRSTVCTDGLNSYREMKGYIHHRHVQHRLKDGEHLLPRVHRAVSLCSSDGCSEPIRELSVTNTSTTTSTNSSSVSTGESRLREASSSSGWHSTPSRSPRRPTKGWCGHKMLNRLSQVNSPMFS